MRRFINSKLGKVLSQVLALTLFIPYVTVLTASKAQAQMISRPAWAVLEFVNTSGKGPNNFGTLAADAFRSELEKTGRYDSIPRETIDRAYTSLNLQPPVTQKTSLLRLGEELLSTTLVTGEIKNYRVVDDGAGRRADVIVLVQVMDVASGVVVNGAGLSASSTVRPRDTAEDILLADALQNAAGQAVRSILSKELPSATVLNTRQDSFLINRGSRSGFKPGQSLIVLRGREQVATAKVGDVDPDSANVKIVDYVRGVQPGDKVRAIFTPPDLTGGWNSGAQAKVSRKIGHGSMSGFWSALLVIGLVAFVVGGNSGNQNLTSVIRAEPINTAAGGLAAVRVSWSPDMYTKGLDRRVEWQVFRFPDTTPIGVTPGTNISFLDDSAAKAFSYVNIPELPAGGYTCDYPGAASTYSTDGVGVGVVSGVPIQYQVRLIYRIPGGELPTAVEEDWCNFVSARTNAIGSATPYDQPVLVSPANGSTISGPVTFSLNSVGTALAPSVIIEYIFEVSSTITFSKGTVYRVAKFTNSTVGGAITAGPFDLSGVFPSATTLYWRVGVRNIDDRPGPAKDPRTGERYIFSPSSTLSRL